MPIIELMVIYLQLNIVGLFDCSYINRVGAGTGNNNDNNNDRYLSYFNIYLSLSTLTVGLKLFRHREYFKIKKKELTAFGEIMKEITTAI